MLPQRAYALIGDVATEARGRKTARPHEVPLFAFRDGARLVVIASRGGNDLPPAWSLNLRAHPDATVRSGGAARRVRARFATDRERARLWRIAADAYPGYETYRTRTAREIPVVVLEDV